MKKTIYFHVGLAKTGTSSLQRFCYNNREILEKNDLLYPVLGNLENPTVNGNYIFFAAHNLSKGAYIKDFIRNNREQFKKEMSAVWNNIKNTIEASKASKIVISSESLGAYPFVFWEFVDHQEYDIKFIVYVRNSFDHLVSLYKQYAKSGTYSGYNRDLNSFVKTAPHEHYYDIINDYSDHLGKENIIVRTYEKERLKNGSTVDDFFDIIGYKVPETIEKPALFNETSSHDTTVISSFTGMFFSALNYDPGLYPMKGLEDRDIGIQKTTGLLPKELIKKICDKYYAKDCALAKKFLGRDELFIKKYPSYYYDETHGQISNGITISYEQLDVLYKTLGKAFDQKVKTIEPFINFLAFFIPFPAKRKAFKAKYRTKFDQDIYRKISFTDLSGATISK